mgnify:CR=1 FL=1
MRVLIVNTSENTGGAAVAANRLKEALNNNGIKAKMLVRDKESDDITVAQLNKSWHQKWDFLWERFVIYMRLHFKRDNLFLIDIANAGTDITKTREFKEADVIHLSWINQGMLSLKGIRKILESNKPVVWTMHDIWPASSICHLTLGCHHYNNGCGNCKYLPGNGGKNDLSAKIWKKKQKEKSIKLTNSKKLNFKIRVKPLGPIFLSRRFYNEKRYRINTSTDSAQNLSSER